MISEPGRWKPVPQNERCSPSNLAGFVFAPNKLAREEYNAALYFEIPGWNFSHQPLGAQSHTLLHTNKPLLDMSGSSKTRIYTFHQTITDVFQIQIKFCFIKSDSTQHLFLIFNCQKFTAGLKINFLNDSFAKGRSGICNDLPSGICNDF